MIESGVVVCAVDIPVQRFRGYAVGLVRQDKPFLEGVLELAYTVRNRAEVHRRPILYELRTGHVGIIDVPNVIDFSVNSQLVRPSDSNRSVSDEFSIDCGRFGDPIVKGVFEDGVGA